MFLNLVQINFIFSNNVHIHVYCIYYILCCRIKHTFLDFATSDNFICFCTGKPGAKIEKVKTDNHKSMSKVHTVHNNYVLSLKEVCLHQNVYLKQTLPEFLDSHQATQEVLTQQW
jgi:hypothetical protein